MPTYTFYIYSASALSYNGATNTFDLDAGYAHQSDRYRIDVTDDDASMADSGDANQLATIYDMNGNFVDSGNIYVPQYHLIEVGPSLVYLDQIEVNGTLYGYVSSEPLTPGVSYPYLETDTTQISHTYYQSNSVPCFGQGTWIETALGPRLIGTIQVGDHVLTYDNGYQPVLWTGSRRVSAQQARLASRLRPVVFQGGFRGVDDPWQPLVLSRQHRIMIDDPVATLMIGDAQVLVAAHHFHTTTLPANGINWHHILLPRHEIIRANGVWVESLFAGDALPQITALGQTRQIRAALRGDGHAQTARPCLHSYEARALLADLRQPRRQNRNKRVA